MEFLRTFSCPGRKWKTRTTTRSWKRRQRNKEAAARCRQRRLELMHTLQEQVDKQKDENRKKDNQIKELEEPGEAG
ncbi:unnamed protein product, partial [Mesorhabditis spiculigera]